MKDQTQSADIFIDGSLGEGGGQILRSALSLSAITGTPFRLDRIRAGRKRPGLMRQHLTCVKAAAEICGANISDVSVGSMSLSFEPGPIAGGNYRFAIGTAGSTSLVLQTVLPMLLRADKSSEVTLEGGTHAIKSPCFEYLNEVFLPAIRQMGAEVEMSLNRYGFYPAGGGEVSLKVKPSELHPMQLHDREELVVTAEVLNSSDIPDSVAKKELRRVGSRLLLSSSQETKIGKSLSPGNVLLLRASDSSKPGSGTLVHICGEQNKRSEQVANEAVREMKRYLNSPAPVDQYLADQWLLPLALAGGGGFTAVKLTPHFHSNVQVIESFLPIKITAEHVDRFASKVELTATT